jgi:hypothetical protein
MLVVSAREARRSPAAWLLLGTFTFLIAACAEAPGGNSFFELADGAYVEVPEPDSGLPAAPPGTPGGEPNPIPPFPTGDASNPLPMFDASVPPAPLDAGRDTGTPPTPMIDAARPPPVVDSAVADVTAPRPDTSTPPPPTGNTCSTTPSYATPDNCSKCICMKCASQVASCYGSPDTAKNTSCKSVRDCAHSNNCTSEACYCGSSPTCLFPDGPCMQVIHAAAGAEDLLGVQAARDDPESPVYRSNQVGTCEMANCASECGL